MRQFHPDLLAGGVTITFDFAANDKGPAVKHHGWPCAAVAKVNSYKNRLDGLDDCSITIDGEWWSDHSEEERIALLDHELHHFQPQKTKTGKWKLDNANRPKVKIREHDFEIGGFHVIAKRHGRSAVEVRAVLSVPTIWIQMELEFMKTEESAAA